MNFIEKNKKNFGYLDGEIPLMTPGEVTDFVRVLDNRNTSSKDTAGLLQNISINMPGQLYSSFSKQVFGERKALGVAMAVAKDDITTAEKIIAGNQLITDAKGKGIGALDPPQKSKLQEVFNSYLGNSIHDSQLREALMDASFNHWAKTTFDKNGSITNIDEPTLILNGQSTGMLNLQYFLDKDSQSLDKNKLFDWDFENEK